MTGLNSRTCVFDLFLYGGWNVFLDSVLVFYSVDRFGDDCHPDAGGTRSAQPRVLFGGARYYPGDDIGFPPSGQEKFDNADLLVFY